MTQQCCRWGRKWSQLLVINSSASEKCYWAGKDCIFSFRRILISSGVGGGFALLTQHGAVSLPESGLSEHFECGRKCRRSEVPPSDLSGYH